MLASGDAVMVSAAEGVSVLCVKMSVDNLPQLAEMGWGRESRPNLAGVTLATQRCDLEAAIGSRGCQPTFHETQQARAVL
jgi:hypothetical protein